MMRWIIAVSLIMLLAACAQSAQVQIHAVEVCGREMSGFWLGLWHGLIAWFGFIGSLLDDSVALYDVCNNGGWYDFGYAAGIGAFGIGGVTGGASRYHRS